MSSPGASPDVSGHTLAFRNTLTRAGIAGVLRVLLLCVLVGCGAGADPGEPANRAEPGEPGNSVDPALRSAESTGSAGEDGASADAAADGDDWRTGSIRMERASTGMVTVTDIRTARHDTFDRFVITLAGDSFPTHSAELNAGPAVQCGSGEPVELSGEAVLVVGLEPARAHDDAGNSTLEPRDTAPGFPALLEARLICDFEGHVEWAFGIAETTAFRVLELTEPARIAVDIQH
jgi:hypothetical protein